MADRRKLQEELNRINELYHQTDLSMNKAGGNIQQRQQLRDMLNKKKESLMAELGDDLGNLNTGKAVNIKEGTITRGAKDTIGAGFDASKNVGLLKMLGKKAAGVIPLAGVGMAALSGNPAQASEELAGDIPVIGQAYEAIKPSDSGNPEEERQMIGDRNIQGNYAKSQAYRDARGISEDEALIEELEGARKQPASKNLPQGKPQRNIFSGLRNLLGK
jgi:hypothetical protein